MIRNIDFLPQRYRDRQAARQNRVWRATVFVAFGGLVAAAFVGQMLIRISARKPLDVIEAEYQQTKAAQQMVDSLQTQVRVANQEADLLTFLRHPWPRTQILRRVTQPLPKEVTLDKLHIGRETPDQTPKTLAVGVIKPVDGPKPAEDKGSPVEQDLKRLREDCDQRRVLIEISGFTSDLTALHIYLNALARETMFAQAELTSIESVDRSDQQRSKFAARLVLAPAYGQRGGPNGPAVNASALSAGRHFAELPSPLVGEGARRADEGLAASHAQYPSPGSLALATLSHKGRGLLYTLFRVKNSSPIFKTFTPAVNASATAAVTSPQGDPR